jgi:HEAT repeat protein
VKTKSYEFEGSLKRKERKMFTVYKNQSLEGRDNINTLPPATQYQPDQKLKALLADLSPEKPWGEREIVAKKIGYMRSSEALPGLLAALQTDPFWMVRCAIIQALERIDDPRAIPTLREIARNDSFHVVREYAVTAIERISPER